MSSRPAPGAIVHVGRAFPGQGSETFPGTLNTRTGRNVRIAKAAGITYAIQPGQDIDPPMPALQLHAPWRQASDALPVTVAATGALAGGIPTTSKKGCCGGTR
jgi:hypothetical protein